MVVLQLVEDRYSSEHFPHSTLCCQKVAIERCGSKAECTLIGAVFLYFSGSLLLIEGSMRGN